MASTTKDRDARAGSRRGSARSSGASTITAKNTNSEDRRYMEKYRDDLSKTTLRAKWIHSPDEHEDRPGQTLATRTPDVVRAWAESRGGKPATVETSRSDKDGRPHVLRIDFPGGSGRRLSSISWDDWFRSFTERKLVFLFQEHRRDGGDSNFFRLDNPQRRDA